MSEIDSFYLKKDEPAKSCLLALRDIILAQDNEITAVWQYGMPFFCYKEKRFCYLWMHKKHKQPYLGIVDGKQIEHPGLLIEKRSRMKIMLFDPGKDLPVKTIQLILQKAISMKKATKKAAKQPAKKTKSKTAVAKPAPAKAELPVLPFSTPLKWERWLEKNHATSDGVWLQIYKKDSGIPTIDHAQALDEALCFGWIDGQAKSYDTQSYLQKFTPRRARSIWSKRNIEHIARLDKEGKMRPAGWKEVEAAKADGRWERAYDSPANMVMPEDFMKLLSKNKKSAAFFNTLSKTNKFAIGWRLQTAKKPETREKRMKVILEMLRNGEKFH
jgi:uncharacterized protein YdeI (YjbR/CyaY-like superfamily)